MLYCINMNIEQNMEQEHLFPPDDKFLRSCIRFVFTNHTLPLHLSNVSQGTQQQQSTVEYGEKME